MQPSKENVGSLLDSLYLEMFDLIEQQTQSRVNIERLSNSGQLLLAKTRYVQGSQSVTAAQIPTENSDVFSALCHTEKNINNDRICGTELSLSLSKPDKNIGAVEPLNWFGLLPPSSLRFAAEQFKNCLTFVVEGANIQNELTTIIDSIIKLKQHWASTYENE